MVDVFEVDDLKVNYTARLCFYKGEPVGLSISMLEIVAYLSRHPDYVRTREQITHFCGLTDTETGRNVDTFMKRIRAAFRRIDPGFNKLKAVHGVGFRWNNYPNAGS